MDSACRAFRRAELRRRKLCLHEQQKVIVTAGFRVGARHVEAAKRMHAHQRARALAIEIEIADVELAAGALDLRFVSRVNRAGQTKLRVVRDTQSIRIVVRFDHRQHRPEDLFLLDRRARIHVGDDRRLDKETLLAVRAAAGNDATAFGFAFLNVTIDGGECFFVDDGAHRRGRVSRIADFDLRRALGDFFDHRVIDAGVDDRARTGGTLLSLVTKRGLDYASGRFVEVRVVSYDDCVLAAHLSNHALNPDLAVVYFRGALVDAQTNFFRAGEGHKARLRMIDDHVPDLRA